MPARRREVVLVLALAAALLVFALVPWLNTPVSRLAAYDGDSREPVYDARVDAGAIRRAGDVVPDGATYYLHAPGASPLLAGNLKAAAQLFLAPALPVRDPAAADWVVLYGTRDVPAGLEARRTVELGRRVAVVDVER